LSEGSGLQDQIRRLIERHVVTFRENVASIGRDIRAMWYRDEASADAVRQARDLAHQMAGAGGSIGFRPVTVAARSLEERLRPIGVDEPIPDIAGQAEIEALFAELERIVLGLTPEESTLYGADLTRYQRRSAR